MTSIKVMKVHNWWASHFGTMTAFIYLITSISVSPPSLGGFLEAFGLFTLASLGIGSFGHLLNDVADVSQDMRSGAQNLVARRGPMATAAAFAFALGLGILPWWWLPTTPAILSLVALEYVLFAVYSLPPFRLKNRGIFGPIADALYAYVLPNAVAVLLFARLGQVDVPGWLMMAILVCCFFFGLERILYHQLIDEPRDRIDAITTFAVTRGWKRAFEFVLRWVIPLESITFVALLAALGTFAPFVVIWFAVYLLAVLRSWSHHGLWSTFRFGRLPSVDRYHLVADRIIARFIWHWLPLASLATLVAANPALLPVSLVHVALFPEPLLWLWRDGIPEASRMVGIINSPRAG